MNKKVRIGIIGSGSFGERHIEAIFQLKNAELVAICDTSESNLQNCSAKYGIESVYTDYKELLKRADVDAVTLPLPDQVHRQIAVDALRAGKHVFCEKPMALNMEDCRAMIQAAKETGKKFMVGQVCRYAPGFILAKKLIDEGKIGDLFFVESEYAHDYTDVGGEGGWRKAPDRHVMIGGGCHAVDLLRWIAGDPEEVFAYENHKVLTDWPTGDCVIALMKFPNQINGKVFVSSGCKRRYTMRTVLYGTKGTIITNNMDNYISLFKYEMADSERHEGIHPENVEVKLPVSVNNHNVAAEIEDFCKAILADEPIATNEFEGAATVAVCTSILESARTGEKVKVEYAL